MVLSTPDLINGLFETFGAFAVWSNVFKLLRDRTVKGITWWYIGVFSLWGYWNLFYYWHLLQWWSWAAGIFVALGNTTWVLTYLMMRYAPVNSYRSVLKEEP